MERVKRDAPPRLRKLYDTEIREKLMQEFSLANRMQAPQADQDHDQHGPRRGGHQPEAARQRRRRAGGDHRPAPGRHQGQEVDRGLQAARRARRSARWSRCAATRCTSSSIAWSTFALPRVRDFKGVSPKSFDGRGNYTLGVREEIIFPEINFEKLDKPKGMNITFNTTAPTTSRGARSCNTSECPSGTNQWLRPSICPLTRSRRSGACVTAIGAISVVARAAFLRKFDLCRSASACSALRGDIPGVIKSSW